MITRTSFAPSKRPYALKLDSFSISDNGRVAIEAVWAGRKRGSTYVSEGELWEYGPTTIDSFMETFDARYGGRCRARWNGTDLWAPDYTPAEHVAAASRLNTILANLPELPAGYDGWFRLS